MNGETSGFKFHCPACGRALTSPTAAIGKRASCPLCKVSITIPSLPASPCGDHAADGGAIVDAAHDHVALAAVALPSNDPPDWRKIVRAHRDFVPLIECPAGVGSGLLVSGDGL